jgi:hypothetical protein
MKIDIYNNSIYNVDENGNRKEHKAISTKFSQIEILKDGRILVLENYYQYKNGENSNLYFLNENLEIEWFVPTTGITDQGVDHYTGFLIKDNKVFGNTWACFRVETDIENRKIIDMVFTR